MLEKIILEKLKEYEKKKSNSLKRYSKLSDSKERK
jgi:hypothetical protein